MEANTVSITVSVYVIQQRVSNLPQRLFAIRGLIRYVRHDFKRVGEDVLPYLRGALDFILRDVVIGCMEDARERKRETVSQAIWQG